MRSLPVFMLLSLTSVFSSPLVCFELPLFLYPIGGAWRCHRSYLRTFAPVLLAMESEHQCNLTVPGSFEIKSASSLFLRLLLCLQQNLLLLLPSLILDKLASPIRNHSSARTSF